jgi:Pyridoxamine 5'-phosphate oxidase
VIASGDAAALADVQRRSYAAASKGLRSSWPESQALDADALAALLARRRYCVLATSRPDGRPHAAPVAFVVASGAFWFGTVEGLRLRNLRSTPWAALVVMEGERDEAEAGDEPPHRALTAEGPVVVHEADAFNTAFEPLRAAWVARHGDPPDWAAALVELRPQRLFSHAAG